MCKTPWRRSANISSGWQHTSPQMPAPVPLIDIPFKRIIMDIVGPLPKSALAHKYILMVLDYPMCYPEAVPLQKATFTNIAKELMLLFSQVGIPKDILTNQGKSFTSCLVQGLRQLLRVRHLCTSVHHPQIDGLVEDFNQTLNCMLRRVFDTVVRNWDLLLPHVLFAV